MALAHYLLSVPAETSLKFRGASILTPSFPISSKCLFSVNFSASHCPRTPKHSVFARFRRIDHKAKAKPQEPEITVATDAYTQFKHLLLPITDRNPYLSEGTRQAIATTTALAKKYAADITVVVIDENQKESLPEHETQLSSIRWYLSEGGFKDYSLLERLGEGSKPTAIIGDVADELNLDLVVISMEAIHTKHIDANLLAEFRRIDHKAKAKPQEPEITVATDAYTQFKHLLLPITDRNPYLSEGTRQAIATTTALAKKYAEDITVVVIDENQKESLPEHETQLSSIRWYLSEGGFKDYSLLERLGAGSKPTAIIGDVADELNLDLVVISMEAIHTKHIDANLLAEFIPCPVILLPL